MLMQHWALGQRIGLESHNQKAPVFLILYFKTPVVFFVLQSCAENKPVLLPEFHGWPNVCCGCGGS